MGYSKPVETIRQEEYPHMNKGKYIREHIAHMLTRQQEYIWIIVELPYMPSQPSKRSPAR